ncbi:MAG: alginate lyase family protein [Parasporobacterium sp.]|nr:alginate lyase family protein [Parasporobacterium sp.]
MLRRIKSIISEYGLLWAVNRILYSVKIKMLASFPVTEKLFEKRLPYPVRLDLFRINTKALERFLHHMDESDKAVLIATAEKICSGVISGFSFIDLNYGDPMNWQLNPMTRKACDKHEKWYKIPDFDKERGDIKVIWEASRFSHFLTLARAYLLTGEKKYYLAWSIQLNDWLENNAYNRGANFKCGQECSFRMVNTLLAYTVFREAGVVTDADTSNVKDLVDRCYRKVVSNFFYAYRCIRNNHTVSELMGMIIGSWCCGDQRRLSHAFRMLNNVIDEQFSTDGGYRQFSFNYQRLVLQDLECILSIEDRVGFKIGHREKIINAALLMYQCQDDSGDMPNYGSNDGALVFPLSSNGYRDFRPVINAVYALAAGKRLYEDKKTQEELIWFGNNKSYPLEKKDKISCQFSDAGLFTIRGTDSWAMIVLNDYHSRPSHFDQLHFDLWVNGINVLCDSGTFSYASDTGRNLVRTASHNTAVVEGKEQMKQYGPFMIYDWTKRKDVKADVNTFEGTIASGYIQTRRVEYVAGRYFITDTVDDDYQILFHTPCEVLSDGNKATLSYEGRVYCTIISDGPIQVKESIRSLYYLKQEAISCISIEGKKDRTIRTEILIGGIIHG